MREISGICVGKEAENKSIITHIQHKEGKKAHSNKPEKEVSQT